MKRSDRWVLALWLAILLSSILVIVRSTFSTGISAFLPASPLPDQRLLVDQLRNGMVSRLLLLAIQNAPPLELAAISKDLAARLRHDPEFVLVQNGDSSGIAPDRALLWRYRYLLSNRVNPEEFTPEGIRRALQRDIQLLFSPVGSLLHPLLASDPTGEMIHLTSAMQKEGGGGALHRSGVWFSKNGKRALLIVQTRSPGFDFNAQKHNLARIQSAFQSSRRSVGSHHSQLLESGPAVFAVHIRDRIKGNVWRLSLLATILVGSLLLAVYRSTRLLGLALLPVLSGAVVGIAAVSLRFGAVDGITVGFGTTLLGEGVDYAIYLFSQTRPGQSPAATLPRIWPTLQLGVLTSVCGFSALLLSDFPGLSQLGLFSIVGLFVAVGVTRWVLPLLMPQDFAARHDHRLFLILKELVLHSPRLRSPLVILMVLITFILILHKGPWWNDHLNSLSPVLPGDRILDQKLRGELGAPSVNDLIAVRTQDSQQALATSEQVGARLQSLRDKAVLAGFDSPAQIVPSRTTQMARQGSIPPKEQLRANLQKALIGLPFRPHLFEPFLLQAESARTGPLMGRESLLGTTLGIKLDSLLFQENGYWTALLPLREVAHPERLKRAVAEWHIPGLVLLNIKHQSDQMYRSYFHTALRLSFIGLFAIVLLLTVALRSPVRVLRVLAPLIGSVMFTLAILLTIGGTLTIFNLIGLLLVVAVGSNYALFFERKTETKSDQERTVFSLTIANICTTIGFGTLSFSSIPVLHDIGITVAIGAFMSLAMSAIWMSSPRLAGLSDGEERS
ncbi:MAG: MMPL family transporter [Leptospirales bacterium]